MREPIDALDADDPFPQSGSGRFWIRQLPYLAMLTLTIFGVGYTSFSNKPLIGYWEVLAALMAIVCIASGWSRASGKDARLRLIWTQALHWTVFLIAMNIVLMPSVQRITDADTIGLTLLLLLAIGTVISGIHILSWQIGFLGIVMAAGVPAIAWLEDSALILFLGVVVVFGVGGMLWWRWREWRASRESLSG